MYVCIDCIILTELNLSNIGKKDDDEHRNEQTYFLSSFITFEFM